MTVITLPPDIEGPLSEEARRQGTTPELLAIGSLREKFVNGSERTFTNDTGKTMADVLSPFIGVLDSSEFVPGGAKMSENTSMKFAEGMVRKRQEGRL